MLITDTSLLATRGLLRRSERLRQLADGNVVLDITMSRLWLQPLSDVMRETTVLAQSSVSISRLWLPSEDSADAVDK